MFENLSPRAFIFTLTLGDDAMQTPEDVAELLERTAKYMRKHGSWPSEKLYDLNGNVAGKVQLI
jgi:hypothetical protein